MILVSIENIIFTSVRINKGQTAAEKKKSADDWNEEYQLIKEKSRLESWQCSKLTKRIILANIF
jgi:hypothetical protein